MKYIALLILLVSLPSLAEDVFTVRYQEGTPKAEEFKLTSKDGKFELLKVTTKKTKKTQITLAATQRLSTALTKLSVKEKNQNPCSEYLNFVLDGQKGKVCQEDRELTREAVQLMYQLNHLF